MWPIIHWLIQDDQVPLSGTNLWSPFIKAAIGKPLINATKPFQCNMRDFVESICERVYYPFFISTCFLNTLRGRPPTKSVGRSPATFRQIRKVMWYMKRGIRMKYWYVHIQYMRAAVQERIPYSYKNSVCFVFPSNSSYHATSISTITMYALVCDPELHKENKE